MRNFKGLAVLVTLAVVVLSGCAGVHLADRPRVDQEIPGAGPAPVKMRKVIVIDKAKATPRKQCPLPKAGQPPMCDHTIASDSNVDGVSQVEDPNAAQLYTIQKDDTLQKISQAVYGSFNEWTRIYEANRDVIKDPNFLKPGTVLNIPPKEEVAVTQ